MTGVQTCALPIYISTSFLKGQVLKKEDIIECNNIIVKNGIVLNKDCIKKTIGIDGIIPVKPKIPIK